MYPLVLNNISLFSFLRYFNDFKTEKNNKIFKGNLKRFEHISIIYNIIFN